MTDNVNHPAHYTQGGIECIDALAAATINLQGLEAVCTANAIKYLWRWKGKNGVEDLKKARWYIDRLIAKLNGQHGKVDTNKTARMIADKIHTVMSGNVEDKARLKWHKGTEKPRKGKFIIVKLDDNITLPFLCTVDKNNDIKATFVRQKIEPDYILHWCYANLEGVTNG